MAPADRLTLFGHLAELRRRLLVALGAWLAGCAAAWFAAPGVLDAVLRPMPVPAVFLGPADAFLLYCKLAVIGGAVLASPVILWQAAGFVHPALRARERTAAGWVLGGGAVCFGAGGWFAWRYLVPATTAFLMSFGSERLRPQIVADTYLNYVLLMVLGCGAAFELPVVTAVLARLRILSARGMLRQWRAATLGCVVVAAVITPSPDAATMIMVAVPLAILYWAGILTAWAAAR